MAENGAFCVKNPLKSRISGPKPSVALKTDAALKKEKELALAAHRKTGLGRGSSFFACRLSIDGYI
ncbi:MAG: hypothetical protein K2P33_02255 [Acutalibacter sp.]|nr:hypothetical protein [Acutalibacter sp.]